MYTKIRTEDVSKSLILENFNISKLFHETTNETF